MEQDIGNAFAELGLTPEATEIEVKAAWRRLVSQWHPDRNGSAAAVAKMQRINRAVEAIRQAGLGQPGAPNGAGSAAPGPSSAPRRPEGGERGDPRSADAGRASASPSDEASATAAGEANEATTPAINRRVRLTLEQAASGCTKVLRGKITATCSACVGAGYQVPGGDCPRCHGSGAVRQRAWFGWVGTQTECEVCHGGGLARLPCGECAGTGKATTRRYSVTVRFPQGVRDGDLLSVPGHPGKPGAPPGDLSIRVTVPEHALLQLDPDGTVRCELPVDGFAWIANRRVEVPTLGGLQSIDLQRGQLRYRLAGQGFPVERRGPRGDQWVTIAPVFPQRMSTDQQILLDQLIATTVGTDAQPADERLRRWHQALGAWKRGGQGRR